MCASVWLSVPSCCAAVPSARVAAQAATNAADTTGARRGGGTHVHAHVQECNKHCFVHEPALPSHPVIRWQHQGASMNCDNEVRPLGAEGNRIRNQAALLRHPSFHIALLVDTRDGWAHGA